MTDIYATDLVPEKRNDTFMGKGFEAAMKKAEEEEDLVIGQFDDSSGKRLKMTVDLTELYEAQEDGFIDMNLIAEQIWRQSFQD